MADLVWVAPSITRGRIRYEVAVARGFAASYVAMVRAETRTTAPTTSWLIIIMVRTFNTLQRPVVANDLVIRELT